MKTLILYASKHGATREIAERIAGRISGSEICDMKKGIPDIGKYDCIIIGSSLYAGMIRKEAKTFLTQTPELMKKALGLFLSGLNEGNEASYFSSNIPENLLKHAKATAFLGGIFDPKKCGFAEKLIMKAVAKSAGYANNVSDEKIARFVEALSS